MRPLFVPGRRTRIFGLFSGIVLLFIIFLLVPFTSASAQIGEDFTVYYDGNGADSGMIYPVTYKAGSNDVTLRENAAESGSADVPYVKKGCVFQGWSLVPNENESISITPILPGGSVWDPVDVPVTWTENKAGFVFYARWDCNAYTITYDGNGAESGEIRMQTGEKNSTVTVKNNGASGGDRVLVRTGYSFGGWNTRADGSGKSYAPGTALTLNSDYQFYAVWNPLYSTPTDVPIVVLTATPLPPTGPSSLATEPSKQSEPSNPQQFTATPTASLLIYPNTFEKVVGKNFTNAPENSGNSESFESIVPKLFVSSGNDLTALPETGITSQSAFLRSQKPASVDYKPTKMELQIPSLDIHSTIVSVESDENGYPVQWLEMDTGLLADSALPGSGFSILAAHNTLSSETFGPFALIRALRTGDRLFIRTSDNDLMIFEVYANEKINEYDYAALYQLGSMFDNTITLMTCEDERVDGGYMNRRIVSAKMIGD